MWRVLSCVRVFFIGATSTDLYCFFFFNDTATAEFYTLSLHDALPIFIQLTLPEMFLSNIIAYHSKISGAIDCEETSFENHHWSCLDNCVELITP